MTEKLIEKIWSKKLWVCVAVFLMTVGTGVTGLAIGNTELALAGGIMTVVGGGIYQACETAIDVANAKSTTTTNTTAMTVSATTTGAKAMDAINGAAKSGDQDA